MKLFLVLSEKQILNYNLLEESSHLHLVNQRFELSADPLLLMES